MQTNDLAKWELRIGEFRVLYNVDTQVRIVEIQRIGEKRGNTFFFQGGKKIYDNLELSCFSRKEW